MSTMSTVSTISMPTMSVSTMSMSIMSLSLPSPDDRQCHIWNPLLFKNVTYIGSLKHFDKVFVFVFHIDSMFDVQNRIIDHANFFQIPQGSSNFSTTQHVLYILNAGGSRISNMTFLCVMKVIRFMNVMKSIMCHISLMQRVQGYQIWHSCVLWRLWWPHLHLH